VIRDIRSLNTGRSPFPLSPPPLFPSRMPIFPLFGIPLHPISHRLWLFAACLIRVLPGTYCEFIIMISFFLWDNFVLFCLFCFVLYYSASFDINVMILCQCLEIEPPLMRGRRQGDTKECCCEPPRRVVRMGSCHEVSRVSMDTSNSRTSMQNYAN
jgi:hypothetical protein